MYKKNLSVVCSVTKRSVQYLDLLSKDKFKLYSVILYKNKKFKNPVLFKQILLLLKKYGHKFIIVQNTNINNKKFFKTIIKNSKRNILLSLYPGEVVKNLQLMKKRHCFHNHTGRLPDYKGSTTIYYSILRERKIYCTTFRINKEIDGGKIFYLNRYKLPKKRVNLDDYDNIIRAKNFVNFLKGKTWKNKTSLHSETYYTIHPILRNLAYKVINGNLDIR